MLTVGNFAILCACTPQTLRYYDRVGLLKPAQVDEWTGYRYYEESQLLDYRRIRDLQGAGFTIGEIRALLHAPAEDVRAALRRKRDELTEKQRRLAELQNSGFPAEETMEEKIEEGRKSMLALCEEISAKDVFNSTHEVPGFGMTVDQLLVYIPQLNQRKAKLRNMAGVLPKARVKGRSAVNSAVIEYTYANYDVEKAKAAADAAAEELARAQTALDKVNNTETMEIDL